MAHSHQKTSKKADNSWHEGPCMLAYHCTISRLNEKNLGKCAFLLRFEPEFLSSCPLYYRLNQLPLVTLALIIKKDS